MIHYNRSPSTAVGSPTRTAGDLRRDAYEPLIVSGKSLKPPLYEKFKEYVTSSISVDGTIAAGYTTDMGPEEVDNRPILWTCK